MHSDSPPPSTFGSAGAPKSTGPPGPASDTNTVSASGITAAGSIFRMLPREVPKTTSRPHTLSSCKLRCAPRSQRFHPSGSGHVKFRLRSGESRYMWTVSNDAGIAAVRSDLSRDRKAAGSRPPPSDFSTECASAASRAPERGPAGRRRRHRRPRRLSHGRRSSHPRGPAQGSSACRLPQP